MAQSPASRRYARALFELAQEQGRLDRVQADLTELVPLMERKAEFAALLERHELSTGQRKDLWTSVVQGRADPLTLRFLHFLVEKRRGPLLGEIIRAFEVLFNAAKGITTLEVVAARPLTEEQMQALSARFAHKLGGQIKAHQKTDASLLGGFLVRVGDVVHDYSVSHQLEQLHHKMVTA
jgi:F-type H+-transporting ATPase subunit delta